MQYEVVYQRVIDDHNDVGYCDDKKKILYIKLGLEKLEELDTFIHEIFHAVEKEYKIKINHTKLDKLATALAEAIVANKLI